jgi:hypothetical protein
MDENFDQRFEVLLDEAKRSGDYVTATKEDFDRMEKDPST